MIQEQIRIRELETALEANRTLLALESKKVRSVHSLLISIGQELGGEPFDQFLKDHLENDLTTEVLATEIIQLVRARLGFSGGPPDTQKTRDHNAALEQATGQAHQIPPTGAENPAWFDLWQRQRDFTCERGILLQVGRISLVNLRQIGKTPADPKEESFITPENIEACCREGLLEHVPGQLPEVVLLTRKGLWAYTRLLQAAPPAGENTAQLTPNRSDTHRRLVLRTADQFAQLGYAVDPQPERVQIDAVRSFQPDLVVSRQDENFVLLVATGPLNDPPFRMEKWAMAAQAGGGRIFMVTDRLASMNSLQSQVIHWATTSGTTCRLYITTTEFLQLVRPGESPWARMREF